MLNYLLESYGGSSSNELTNSVYYCYTIKDTETGKYYSGSRGVEGINCHDLLVKYFTSSTVIDFKEKLKKFPDLFEYRIEYFSTRSDAFDAEKAFHQKHQVGKNTSFINSMTAGGTNCGAGTVLCKDEHGNTYRVTVEEFSNGNHQHISKGMMNIRTENGIEKIPIDEFDPEIHITEFKDYVLAIDTETGTNCRIPKTVFESDPRYVGITKGMVIAYDTVTHERVQVTQYEFDNSNGRFVGHTNGQVAVIDRTTGEKRTIEKEKYDKSVYKHSNTGSVVAYSFSARTNVSISMDEYRLNSDDYANQTTKVFYVVDGKFFKSKNLLDQYYRRTRGKSVLKISQFDMTKKFNDIETITKDDHKNGKN